MEKKKLVLSFSSTNPKSSPFSIKFPYQSHFSSFISFFLFLSSLSLSLSLILSLSLSLSLIPSERENVVSYTQPSQPNNQHPSCLCVCVCVWACVCVCVCVCECVCGWVLEFPKQLLEPIYPPTLHPVPVPKASHTIFLPKREREKPLFKTEENNSWVPNTKHSYTHTHTHTQTHTYSQR